VSRINRGKLRDLKSGRVHAKPERHPDPRGRVSPVGAPIDNSTSQHNFIGISPDRMAARSSQVIKLFERTLGFLSKI